MREVLRESKARKADQTSQHTLPRDRSCRTAAGGRLVAERRRHPSYALSPEVLVAEILRLFVGDQVVAYLGDVDETVQLAPYRKFRGA